MTDMQIDALLNDRSHHIEFNGHLTNHVKHAVIALQGMGIEPDAIRAYYDNYAHMTPYGHGLEPARPVTDEIDESNWQDFLGRRCHWAAYCRFFDQRITDLGLDGALQRFLPVLLAGWAGALSHATIHLGLALDVNHRWMTVEGLAYMAFSYVSCHPQRIEGETAHRHTERLPVDSMLRLASDWACDREGLRSWAETLLANAERTVIDGIHPELVRSGLQYRIALLLTKGHPLLYRLPSWIDALPTDECWEPMFYQVTLLYLAKPGDFVLLHLITALHAIEQIAQRLPSHEQKQLIRNFWLGMQCISIAGASFPKLAKLRTLDAHFSQTADSGEHDWSPEWQQLIVRAAEEEEEHNPKLVFVLQRWWYRSGRHSLYRVAAGQFTATPALPPSFQQPPTD